MEKETDEYCQKIFAYLVANNKEIRFNQLYSELKALDVKITKPTLIQHLNHLHAKRFILRKEKGKQNVSYQVNWKKFEPLDEALKFKKVIAHTLENEKIFKSKSLEQQIVYVTTILTWEQILHLQFNVLNLLEPKTTFNTTLGYVFIHRLYDTYRRWLLDTCKQSRENTQKAFDSLQRKRDDFENLLFDRPAKPSMKNTP
ncbi:MAG TPA: hypothetical protein VMT26_04790 [Candidatus Bathyarchaeia archaeon]|nr:hypothetical protein [Candidatus Bathyarchaeia archaeon]